MTTAGKTFWDRVAHDAAAADAAFERIQVEADTGRSWLRSLQAELSATPLPAPALAEDAIVAALKVDPGMAGRVMARVAYGTPRGCVSVVGDAARDFAQNGPSSEPSRAAALQSLAIALAAASYRG